MHPTALTQSEKLTQLIRQIVQESNGFVSFARFMERALYTPGLGYYSANTHPIGRFGDFITAPEISPLFAQCIAHQCQEILTALPGGDILECGAGSGALARDLLLELENLNCLPAHYYILEISTALRAQQQQLLQSACPHLMSRIHWLDSLPQTPIRGVIFGNEVMDALPVHLFALSTETILERGVGLQDDHFIWQLQPATGELKERIAAILAEQSLPTGYQSEINLWLPGWIRSMADSLQQGTLLLIDYGYGQREYYHPERIQGTFTCFYQHHHHTDPFIHIGLQDMTAHVDFTCVAESGCNNGLQLAGFTTQAAFLFACQLLERAAQRHKQLLPHEQYQQNQAIKTLTMPAKMGEVVKVIAFNKNFDLPLSGFNWQDRRRNL